MKKVAVIHTSFVSVNDLKALFAEIVPEAQIINIVDDSLLPEVIANGGVTSGVVSRMCMYALQAQSLGVDLIFNQCSSVGEAFDIASRCVHVPTLKVDQAMAEKAVQTGTNIHVIATVATTLGPSCRLIEAVAQTQGKHIILTPCLVKGAFEALTKEGNKEKHNQMVLNSVQNAQTADVIVLAQGSMIALLPRLTDIKTPVLTSPRLGVERARVLLVL